MMNKSRWTRRPGPTDRYATRYVKALEVFNPLLPPLSQRRPTKAMQQCRILAGSGARRASQVWEAVKEPLPCQD